MRKSIVLAAAIGAVLLSSCTDKKDPTAVAPAPAPRPTADVVVNTPPASVSSPEAAMPEFEVPERVTRLMSTPVGPGLPPGPPNKIDTTTAERFVTSLQQIERAATKDKVDMLRGALTVLQFQTQHKISALAAGQAVAPQFTDEQLMQIAFADINGMTADQVIAHAKKIAPQVVPTAQ